MTPTCPHRHRGDPPICTPEGALTALSIASDAGRRTCVLVGGLDRARRPLTLVVVDDAGPGDVAVAVEVTVLRADVDRADVGPAAVFLASSGGAAVAEPGPAEVALLDGLDARLARAGIVLLDWFMLRDGEARSASHWAGRRARW